MHVLCLSMLTFALAPRHALFTDTRIGTSTPHHNITDIDIYCLKSIAMQRHYKAKIENMRHSKRNTRCRRLNSRSAACKEDFGVYIKDFKMSYGYICADPWREILSKTSDTMRRAKCERQLMPGVVEWKSAEVASYES